jgi:2-haloacid dehalogenase
MPSPTTAAPGILVFDVNETLLDLSVLRPGFTALLGDPGAMGEWFVRMLHGSLLANHLGAYRPFGEIGAEALVTMARRRGIEVSRADADAVVEGMRRLPAHPEVPAALDRLREAGFRAVALTNGSADVASDQMANAGIADRFERIMSVDSVRRFKPAPEVYLHAAAMLDAEVDEMTMVASHDWDLLGARSVGMPGAFLERPGVVWGMAPDPPEVRAGDLDGLATILIQRSRS